MPARGARRGDQAARASGSILVVDDHPHVITSVGRLLRPYRPILGAKSGTEAIEIIDGGVRLCGAIIDLNLGEGPDGTVVLAHLRKHHAWIPVLMLSGEMTIPAHLACNDHHAQYIPKGCASGQLLATFGVACLLADYEPDEDLAEVEADFARRFDWSLVEAETVSNAVRGQGADWYESTKGVPKPTHRSRSRAFSGRAGWRRWRTSYDRSCWRRSSGAEL